VNPWVTQQVAGVKALEGQVVRAWNGVEMAVRSNNDETVFVFTDPQVPCLQLWALTIESDDGALTRLSNYQNDTEFGLVVDPGGVPLDELHSDGYRLRALEELPLGKVTSAGVRLSGLGDLTEIELVVAGEFLLLVAGETYETWTERIEIRRYDESILVFRSQADYDSIDWIPPDPPGTLL
jgi:hypothetical protein